MYGSLACHHEERAFVPTLTCTLTWPTARLIAHQPVASSIKTGPTTEPKETDEVPQKSPRGANTKALCGVAYRPLALLLQEKCALGGTPICAYGTPAPALGRIRDAPRRRPLSPATPPGPLLATGAAFFIRSA